MPEIPPARKGQQMGINMTSATDITTTTLAEHAEAIRKLGKRVVGDIIEIGRRLTDAKELVGHGNWLPWLDREFGWSDQTARNFIRLYDLSESKSKTVLNLDLPVKSLYLLAAPSTPEQARDEIVERAKTGEPISTETVKETIAKTRTDNKGDQPTTRNRAAAASMLARAVPELPHPFPPSIRGKPLPLPPPARDDIGPASPGELARLNARIQELENQNRVQQTKIGSLEGEVEEIETEVAVLKTKLAKAQAVPPVEGLAAKLEPLIDKLFWEGKASAAAASPATVAITRAQIERLLVESGVMPKSRRLEDPKGYVDMIRGRQRRADAKAKSDGDETPTAERANDIPPPPPASDPNYPDLPECCRREVRP
jgi:hypothetical protein